MLKFAKDKSDINCDLNSLIYCFEIEELDENGNKISVIKIGKTINTIKERITGYNRKDIKNIYWIQVENIDNFEYNLIKYLTKQLNLNVFKGREYFLTNIEIVKQSILDLDKNINNTCNQALKCEFCNKVYSSKYNLTLHQKTAKFCFKLQTERKQNEQSESQAPSEEERKGFKCEFCSFSSYLKSSVIRHQESCKEKIKKVQESSIIQKEDLLAKALEDIERFKKETEELKKENQKLSTELIIEKAFLKNERQMNEQLKIERENLLKQLFDLKSTPSITNNNTTYNTSQSSLTKVANICGEYSKFNNLALPSPEDEKTLQLKETKKEYVFDISNFSNIIARIKHTFFKYNFEALNYGLHKIGGFLYQFLDQLELKVNDDNEIIAEDDHNYKVRISAKQLFTLLSNMFQREEFVNILCCNKYLNPEFIKNAFLFNHIFITKSQQDENLIDAIYRGITNNNEY
jgi:hypothetical protein